MKTYFLDTGYLLALELSNDQDHLRTLKHWQTLAGSRIRLVTTSSIFEEVVTFFNNRRHHAKAVEVGTRLLRSATVELVHVDESLFAAAWKYFHDHDDKEYSFADCVSFVVMSMRQLTAALSLDRHFEQAGFRRLP